MYGLPLTVCVIHAELGCYMSCDYVASCSLHVRVDHRAHVSQ